LCQCWESGKLVNLELQAAEMKKNHHNLGRNNQNFAEEASQRIIIINASGIENLVRGRRIGAM